MLSQQQQKRQQQIQTVTLPPPPSALPLPPKTWYTIDYCRNCNNVMPIRRENKIILMLRTNCTCKIQEGVLTKTLSETEIFDMMSMEDDMTPKCGVTFTDEYND